MLTLVFKIQKEMNAITDGDYCPTLDLCSFSEHYSSDLPGEAPPPLPPSFNGGKCIGEGPFYLVILFMYLYILLN